MSEKKEEVKDKKKSPMAIASLPLGIISILFNFFWYFSIPTGVLAIVFGVKAIKKVGSKLGKAGMITGIIGLSLCVFIYVSMIMCISFFYL